MSGTRTRNFVPTTEDRVKLSANLRTLIAERHMPHRMYQEVSTQTDSTGSSVSAATSVPPQLENEQQDNSSPQGPSSISELENQGSQRYQNDSGLMYPPYISVNNGNANENIIVPVSRGATINLTICGGCEDEEGMKLLHRLGAKGVNVHTKTKKSPKAANIEGVEDQSTRM